MEFLSSVSIELSFNSMIEVELFERSLEKKNFLYKTNFTNDVIEFIYSGYTIYIEDSNPLDFFKRLEDLFNENLEFLPRFTDDLE